MKKMTRLEDNEPLGAIEAPSGCFCGELNAKAEALACLKYKLDSAAGIKRLQTATCR